MALNKVELCGVNTAKLPLLKEEEKEALFVRIKQGDEKAREEYIKGNLRLVLSVIKRFSSSNENADDLFQIGCVGLMKAVDHFDPGREVKFSTYAVPMNVLSRNPRRRRIMTRKQAILAAIQELQGRQGMDEIVEKLLEFVEDLPVTHWDEKTIFDAIEHFRIEHGRYPQGREFQKRELPTVSSIFNRFKVTTMEEFWNTYYPERREERKCDSPKYYEKTPKEWIELFKEQYTKNSSCQFANAYNRYRDKCTPMWETIARLNGVTTWNELLNLCEIPLRTRDEYRRRQQIRIKASLTLRRSYTGMDVDDLENLKEKLKTNMEEITNK